MVHYEDRGSLVLDFIPISVPNKSGKYANKALLQANPDFCMYW
jgi:hypothetical protein